MNGRRIEFVVDLKTADINKKGKEEEDGIN